MSRGTILKLKNLTRWQRSGEGYRQLDDVNYRFQAVSFEVAETRDRSARAGGLINIQAERPWPRYFAIKGANHDSWRRVRVIPRRSDELSSLASQSSRGSPAQARPKTTLLISRNSRVSGRTIRFRRGIDSARRLRRYRCHDAVISDSTMVTTLRQLSLMKR